MQHYPRLISFLRTASTRSTLATTASSTTSSHSDPAPASQKSLGIPGANLGGISCGLTSTSVGGGWWSLGDRGFSPFQGGTNVFTVSDSFDMIRGKHNIKIGGEFRANQMNVETNAFQDGFWVFSNLWSRSDRRCTGGNNMADFLLGFPSLALHDQTFEGATTAVGGSFPALHSG